MTTVYAIKDWAKNFENAQSRKVEDLDWVRVPIHHGLRYKRLMKSKGGVEAFGVFIALVEVAATCEPRGVLIDESGPLTLDDLSEQTGIDTKTLQRGISLLESDRIGWVVKEPTGSIRVEPDSTQVESDSTTMESESTKVSLDKRERRGEERKEESERRSAAAARAGAGGVGVTAEDLAGMFPVTLDTPTAHAAFLAWLEARREKHGSATRSEISNALALAEPWGHDLAVQAFRQAAAGCWKNLRPPEAARAGANGSAKHKPDYAALAEKAFGAKP